MEKTSSFPLMTEQTMMHNAIQTATREQRTSTEAHQASWISDEELNIALRAAGVSAEDVEFCLAADMTHSPDAHSKYSLPS